MISYFRKLSLLGFGYIAHNLVYKVTYKIGLSSSKTVFMKLEANSNPKAVYLSHDKLKLVKLTPDHLASLKKILIFNDALTDGFFEDNSKGAFVALNQNNDVVAYSFYETGQQHIVNGWASVCMDRTAAWVGPVFVHPKYRGNKLNKVLYHAIFDHLSDKKNNFITCINSNNAASIKSHENMGFMRIGEVVRSRNGAPKLNSQDASFTDIVKIL